ncbi:nuclear transport factor 2 family protein [Pseudoxanthomonas sacheonensis]|uniref:nuclear transport factor 2 family protein n=1 Tax=Pseudoxanthomonas sacheonensis TaxID=443615 RepID=UPI0013D0CA45|nr:nuclear transport factor 2 family protein [Pseudoxanthomonas sacheonensis]KAF1707757.1 hypothetical protein CSC73_10560 [Pseudoxanthomonas sacheonensis]
MRSLLLSLLLAPLGAFAAENTPEQTVSTLWSALSNDPGATADLAALKRIFHEDAVVFGGRYKEGVPLVQRSMAEDFLKSYERPGQKGFHECEVSRVVQTYDRFAVAYSVVESRTDKTAAAPDFVGVNSVQLYKMGSQWKILSLYYHVEKQGLPIPLGDGRPGKCIA